MMTINQIDQLKNAYAEMIVEGMDMKTLITLAVESIEQNLKDYNMDELKGEIIDCYGEETWEGLGGINDAHNWYEFISNPYSNLTN